MTDTDTTGIEGRKVPNVGSVPRSWLDITGTWSASQSLTLLRVVDAAGVAHDDLSGVRRLWEAIAPATEVDPNEPTGRIYLDIANSMLTEREMNEIGTAPPRVILHEYGAWVHVSPDEHDDDPLDPAADEEWADFPNLNAVLRAARDRGADWVNFDVDGHDIIPGLPTFDW